MPKDDLLAWARARLPKPPAIREGGCQLLIADTAALLAIVPALPTLPGQPHDREGGCQLHIADTEVPPAALDLALLEDDFLDGLEGGTPSPGYLLDEDYYAERARAELAGRLAEWESLRSAEGARAARAFLDGLGLPRASLVKDQLGKALVTGSVLNDKRRRGTPRRDIPAEWEKVNCESG